MSDRKPFKIKNVHRSIRKDIFSGSLEELRNMAAEKFEKPGLLPTIHLDSDGTEVDDEEYYRTLEPNAELIAVFPGEQWIDPTQYVSISSHSDTTDAAAETQRIDRIVDQLQDDLCNVSTINEQDLESLSNMDPNSLVDITGKDFMEQFQDTGRPLFAKRTAEDRISLLKLLKDGAIFCSERYPEEAENIEFELNREMNGEGGGSGGNSTPTTPTQRTDNRTYATTKTIEVVEMTAAETIMATTTATVAVVERECATVSTTTTTTTATRNTNDI